MSLRSSRTNVWLRLAVLPLLLAAALGAAPNQDMSDLMDQIKEIASTNRSDGLPASDIPPLAPPLPEIAPTFFEKHPALRIVIPSAVTAFVFGLLLGIWMRPRKPPALAPPAVQARGVLTSLESQVENGAVLSQVSQTLRRYLINAFWLPPHEMTTSDFCSLLNKHEKINPGLSAMLTGFLRACDERKFAPGTNQPPLEAARRAIELVELAEARLATIRNAAVPPVRPPAGETPALPS